jgi:hypothetical protein
MYKKHGQLVEEATVQQIANSFILSHHAKERLPRWKDVPSLKDAILNNSLAYYNTDGSINIGVDDYRYMVVVKKDDGAYLIVTLKETIYEPRTSIYERRELALKGIERIPNSRNLYKL